MKTCFLCHKKCNVLDFNNASFKKCSLMLLFRRKKKYKYHDTFLTIDSCTDYYGYHSKCLKKITVLRQNDKNEFEDFCKTQTIPSLPSDFIPGQSIAAVSCDLEKSINDQLTTYSEDEQLSITASNEQLVQENESWSFQNLLSSGSMPHQAISSTPRNKKEACLFCGHVEKKVGKKRIYVTFASSEATVEKIKSMAEKSDDSNLLAKLESFQYVTYHSNCLSSYQIKLKRLFEEPPKPRYWQKNRQFHQLAFNAISEIIKADIIEKSRVIYLADLLSQYKSLLLKFAEGQVIAEDLREYRAENLKNKIKKVFGDRITVGSSTIVTAKREIDVECDMDTSQLSDEIVKLESTEKNPYRDIAYELRNCIISQESAELPDNLTPEDGVLGERSIPEQLLNFVYDLVRGPDSDRNDSGDDLPKIKSVCNHLIHIVTQGRVKPSKHLGYGHTIFDTEPGKIKIEMTYSSEKENNVTPAGISPIDGLNSHVAFDNFVESVTEKNTHTGHIYHFRNENNDPNNMDSADASDSEFVGEYANEGPMDPLA